MAIDFKYLLLITSFIIAPLTGCSFFEPSEGRQPISVVDTNQDDDQLIRLTKNQYEKIGITTVQAKIQDVPVNLQFEGEVTENDYKTTPILSLVSGRVEDIDVQVGDEVKKGDILTTLRSDEVARIESELLEKVLILNADIEQATVKFNLAKKQYERNKLLFGEGISARANLENSEGEFEETRIIIKNLQDKKKSIILSAKERFRLFGIKSQEIDEVLSTGKIDDLFQIVSPANGTLIERNVDLGQLVDTSSKLFEISDLSTVWMKAQSFEKDLRHLKRGQLATIIIDSYPEHPFKGVLDNIANVMNAKTRTLSMRATVDNREGLLKPNMFGKMKLQISTKKRFVLPVQSVQKIGETDIVFVEKEPGVFEERHVVMGAKYDQLQEVVSGLDKGEKVALKGSLELMGLLLKKDT